MLSEESRHTPARLVEFIDSLARHDAGQAFNPWMNVNADDAEEDAVAQRRERLAQHFGGKNVKYLLCGEAPGYQGCRSSGVAFTSERLVLEGSIPRVTCPQGRMSRRYRPWSEPSATIVWSGLYRAGIAEETVLFNAFPFHPSKPGDPLSNRAPTQSELDDGLMYLEWLLEIFDGVEVGAVGRNAEASISRLGISAVALRHPANGGATKFTQGLMDMASAS